MTFVFFSNHHNGCHDDREQSHSDTISSKTLNFKKILYMQDNKVIHNSFFLYCGYNFALSDSDWRVTENKICYWKLSQRRQWIPQPYLLPYKTSCPNEQWVHICLIFPSAIKELRKILLITLYLLVVSDWYGLCLFSWCDWSSYSSYTAYYSLQLLYISFLCLRQSQELQIHQC